MEYSPPQRFYVFEPLETLVTEFLAADALKYSSFLLAPGLEKPRFKMFLGF